MPQITGDQYLAGLTQADEFRTWRLAELAQIAPAPCDQSVLANALRRLGAAPVRNDDAVATRGRIASWSAFPK